MTPDEEATWRRALQTFPDDHPHQLSSGARAPSELVALGADAVPLMIEIAGDWDEPLHARRGALWVLSQAGTKAVLAVEPLISLLADRRFVDADDVRTPEVNELRMEVSFALGDVAGQHTAPLMSALDGGSWPQRVGAVVALGRVARGPGADAAADALIRTLNGHDWEDVELSIALLDAAQGLGSRAAAATDKLIEGLTVQDVQGLAAAALRGVGEAAVPALVAVLAEGLTPTMTSYAAPLWQHVDPTFAVIDVLIDVGGAALTALLDVLPDERMGRHALMAAHAFATRGDDDARAQLAGAESVVARGLTDPETCYHAAAILREVGSPASRPALDAARSQVTRWGETGELEDAFEVVEEIDAALARLRS